MKIYLVQHGDALPKEADPQRCLSERGRRDIERIAAFLGNAKVRVSGILHSGKKRAEQTAVLLAASVGAVDRPDKTSGIDPLDPVDAFVPLVNAWTEDTMVVGHLPFMGRLVSHLIFGNDAASTVAFVPGTVVCLERSEDGHWSIAWMVPPDLLVGGSEKAV